ncbi:MAG: MBL fold metallo-hydrolase [Desulfobacter sp.]|nr:MAG: MBL fold metallo-hydrolase [Desulfobacter sp.]
MEIQWLGTAGFRIATSTASFLIDPYLSRNPGADPRQELRPADLAPASHIFVSHGHFDHLLDVPAVARQTGAEVWCSPTAARTLEDMGLAPGQIRTVEHNGAEADFSGIRAQAFYSRHIRFDFRLMAATLARVGRRLPDIIPLFANFPCGQVLSWQFELEGRRIRFFGSAGASDKELEGIGKGEVDILMLPLQGHSKICAKGARHVRFLEPGMVIPHHQDDFYPPVSQTVDISDFVHRVQQDCPGTQIREMALNEIIQL